MISRNFQVITWKLLLEAKCLFAKLYLTIFSRNEMSETQQQNFYAFYKRNKLSLRPWLQPGNSTWIELSKDERPRNDELQTKQTFSKSLSTIRYDNTIHVTETLKNKIYGRTPSKFGEYKKFILFHFTKFHNNSFNITKFYSLRSFN